MSLTADEMKSLAKVQVGVLSSSIMGAVTGVYISKIFPKSLSVIALSVGGCTFLAFSVSLIAGLDYLSNQQTSLGNHLKNQLRPKRVISIEEELRRKVNKHLK